MQRCPSHARVVEGELGPCVLTHLPCAEGHYDCLESRVQLLPVASVDRLLARIDVMGSRLDKAHDENQSLKRRITLLTGSSGLEGARHGQSKFVAENEAVSPSEVRANAEGILLQV